ncbi:hypothetical protein V5O48_006272 [Marasmius crinis-equi]|uniref:Uncharacterized protein n=1 Tax=Marasmius crinis-equi TaxID=585013 RepID=A0ABR3FKD5_9AGAR
MDLDPLADSGPSRYAVESDEEDEYNPLEQKGAKDNGQNKFEFKIAGSIPTGAPLLAAFGDAGKYWTKGANLGEQSGAIFVNNIQVGLVFNPSWTKSTVVVSETFNRLPVNGMNDYSSYLVSELKPSIVSILDVYPSPTYISPTPIPQHEAPIRYLCSSKVIVNPHLTQLAQSFAPPNLLHSTTSAALMAHLVTTSQTAGILILLPFPRVTMPPPKTLQHSDFSHLAEDEFQWSSWTMNDAQKLLLLALGEDSPPDWTKPRNSGTASDATAHESRTIIGEGGMYI